MLPGERGMSILRVRKDVSLLVEWVGMSILGVREDVMLLGERLL
jgi:hypothetical protein